MRWALFWGGRPSGDALGALGMRWVLWGCAGLGVWYRVVHNFDGVRACFPQKFVSLRLKKQKNA